MKHTIKVEDDPPYEREDVIVATAPVREGEALYFEDNLTGVCFKCGCKVQFRPYVPIKTKKICTGCILKAMKENPEATGDFRVDTEALREAAEYIKKHGCE